MKLGYRLAGQEEGWGLAGRALFFIIKGEFAFKLIH